MALLHLFKEIIPSSYLHILHCNHGVRTEAHNDAVFVEKQAKLLRIPIHLRIHMGLKQLTSGFQAAAREWRRQEAEHLCKLLKLSFIVQGHHKGDQLETRLHRMLRGTHLSNLQGMRVKQGHWLRHYWLSQNWNSEITSCSMIKSGQKPQAMQKTNTLEISYGIKRFLNCNKLLEEHWNKGSKNSPNKVQLCGNTFKQNEKVSGQKYVFKKLTT